MILSLEEDEVIIKGWLSLSSLVIGLAAGLRLMLCVQEQSVNGWL